MERDAERRPGSSSNRTHFENLVGDLRALEENLRSGGGPERIARQHSQNKLTARERVVRLLDPETTFLEIGLLVAYDRYEGQAPAAGVVTGVGVVRDREVVVVANDATVKAGAWWPETITKILRAQEIAMRSRVPIIYLVDSAGVNLPYQGGVFPGSTVPRESFTTIPSCAGTSRCRKSRPSWANAWLAGRIFRRYLT
jgi:acetyl-CoA carboxylase carboxyltransferase component